MVFSKQTKPDRILDRSDLAPVLLYPRKLHMLYFAIYCLCLVTEQQIVFMPKNLCKEKLSNGRRNEDLFSKQA